MRRIVGQDNLNFQPGHFMLHCNEGIACVSQLRRRVFLLIDDASSKQPRQCFLQDPSLILFGQLSVFSCAVSEHQPNVDV